jgi:hypothetical protein
MNFNDIDFKKMTNDIRSIPGVSKCRKKRNHLTVTLDYITGGEFLRYHSPNEESKLKTIRERLRGKLIINNVNQPKKIKYPQVVSGEFPYSKNKKSYRVTFCGYDSNIIKIIL